MFTRQEVRDFIRARKQIQSVTFHPANRRRNLPKFLGMTSSRFHCTDLLDAGENFKILFAWRDGAELAKRSFCAWFFIAKGEDLVPIARFDHHLSHKGFHLHLNCEEERDLTNRRLPGAKDLQIKGTKCLDPSLELDRNNLVIIAMRLFNVRFAQEGEGLF